MVAVRLFTVNAVAGGIGLHAPSVAGLLFYILRLASKFACKFVFVNIFAKKIENFSASSVHAPNISEPHLQRCNAFQQWFHAAEQLGFELLCDPLFFPHF